MHYISFIYSEAWFATFPLHSHTELHKVLLELLTISSPHLISETSLVTAHLEISMFISFSDSLMLVPEDPSLDSFSAQEVTDYLDSTICFLFFNQLAVHKTAFSSTL